MANYERVSPGMYRGPDGRVVRSERMPTGPARPMQGPRRQPPTGGPAYAGGSQQFNERTGMANPMMSGGTGADMFAGGTPNFDERTGQPIGGGGGGTRPGRGPTGNNPIQMPGPDAPPGRGPDDPNYHPPTGRGTFNGNPMGNPSMFAGGNPQFDERRGQMMQQMGMPSGQMRTADYIASRDGPFNGQGYSSQMAQQSLGQPPQGWGPQQPPQGMPARPIASAPPPAYMPPKGPQGGGAFAGRKAAGVTGAPPNKRRGLYGGQLGG